jgi:hypothetical protein
MNKNEMEQLIAQLQAENDELRQQIAARDAALSGASGGGWLITSPNPRYTGVTAGVEFRAGRAFIPEGQPGAEARVRQLQLDFGYRVTQMAAADFQALKQDKVEPDKARQQANLLTQPAVFGQ